MYVPKKQAWAVTCYSWEYFEGGRLRVLCHCCTLGSRVTTKIQRSTYFCALNKKSLVTEYKYGEAISKFIYLLLLLLYLLRITSFETDEMFKWKHVIITSFCCKCIYYIQSTP